MAEIIDIIFILSTTVGLLIYLLLTWNFNYWKKKGVCGPKPKILYGTIPSLINGSRNVVYDIQDIYHEYKSKGEKFAGIFFIQKPQLLLIDPSLIREVLVTNFKNFQVNYFASWTDAERDPLVSKNPFLLKGSEWKERRAEITPALTANRIKASYTIMQNVCERLNKYLEEKTLNPPEEGIDAKDVTTRFTLEVVTNCIYGIEAGAFSSQECRILKEGTKIFEDNFSSMLIPMFYTQFPILRKLYNYKFIKPSTEKFFTNLMNDAVKIREQSKDNRVDYLNYLLQLREKKNLSTLDMASHTLTFFLDGFETSSGVICNCLYLLALNKDIQSRLRTEIQDTIKENGEITFENLHELTYLDQVFNETLRLLPPGAIINKVCTEPHIFTNSKDEKITIEKGDVVLVPIYCIHRDEEYYPNPEEFNPDRFSPENGGVKKYKDMGVFLPFSDGPRICLGMRFALTQSKAAVATIVKNFDVSLNKRTKTDVKLSPKLVILAIDGGVWLDFKKIAEK